MTAITQFTEEQFTLFKIKSSELLKNYMELFNNTMQFK